MWNDYRKAKDDLHAPEEWKNDILKLMNNIEPDLPNQLPNVVYRPPQTEPSHRHTILKMLLILIGVFVNFRGGSHETPSHADCPLQECLLFEEITDQEYIQLLTLGLQPYGQQIIIRPPEDVRQPLTLDTFEEQINLRLSRFTFTGFVQAEASIGQSAPGTYATYSFLRGDQRATLTVNLTSGQLETNSVLRHRAIGLYTIDDDIHVAIFQENGTFFQIAMTDTTEERFIEYVQQLIDFVER